MTGTRTWQTTARVLALLALGLVLMALTARVLRAQDGAASLAEADRLYEEKSYAAALKGYERFLKGGMVPQERRDLVQYRVAVSLGKTEQWDRALESGLEFVKTHRGTVWEPRGLYWLGRLYLAVPHEGYRVREGMKDEGGRMKARVYRGRDVPKVEGDAKPEQVYLWEQDFRNAKDALEAARVLYPRHRAASPQLPDEEIQLNHDLARTLQGSPEYHEWGQKQEWKAPSDPEWKIDPAAEYSPDWAPPKKQMYLFEQIRALALGELPNTQRPTPNAHQAALSLLGQALWLQGYHQAMQQWAQKYVKGEYVRLPYPYQDHPAEEPLRRLVRDYPDDPIRDQAQYTLGTLLESKQDYVAAVAEFRRLVRERPESKWVADARFRIQEITRRNVAVWDGGGHFPGKPATIHVTSRNVPAVHFEAFRVRLEEVMAEPAIADPQRHHDWADFRHLMGDLKDAGKRYGPMVARWDAKTDDKGEHKPQGKQFTTPLKEPGAYVVEASAAGVRSATIVVVSDRILIEKLSRDHGLFYLTDHKTGAPAANVEVLGKQWWWEAGGRRSALTRGRTNADGLFSLPLMRAPGRTGFQAAALAYNGSSYALSPSAYTHDQGDNPDTFRVYSVTDRSVYRPAQTVYYRQLLMRRERGDLAPLAGKHVRVEIRNPQGQVVHQDSGTSSEFGSVNGEFNLSGEAPLGEYIVHVSVPDEARGPTQFGGNRFRVEEYKKPEVEVTVEPSAERVRLGEKTTAKVSAAYYFGGPVPDAKVTYRVYRYPWAQSYRFPRPFDFLYRYHGDGDYSYAHRNGEVIAQGETKTGEDGTAAVSFPTSADESRWKNMDFTYTVEVDVQDASRRVISGSGSVKATRRDVAVFLDFPRGYASKGDEVKVEIITLNPADQPVSVPGTAKVFRYPETPDAKETLVHSEALKTDRQGRAYLRWKAKEGGRYRVAFETRDSAEQEVSGSTDVWVQGPELEKGRFLYQGIVLKTEALYYEEGQTASVLLVTPEPGCTVLLTREANNEITQKQVVRVPGRSLELKLPLTRADVPNFYLSAVLVRNGQMLQATEEVFVPSVRQFATVKVEAEKGQYGPGEKAKLRLHASDWQGRPLRTELSVAVTDASLAYIQKDYRPDIRTYYYGDRRSHSVQMTGSPAARFQPGAEDTQPRGEFKTHEWVLPEGMGQLQDWPGDQGRYRRHHYFSQSGLFGVGGMGGFGGGVRFRANAREAQYFARDEAAAVSAPSPPGMPADNSLLVRGGAEDIESLKRAQPAKPGRQAGQGGEEPEARSNFADTAFWTPAAVTDARGNATVEVTWPDNLTRWRAAAVGNSATGQVGAGETSVRTKKDLLVRLQAPRFFVERDTVTVTANVHNYLPKAAKVKVRLDLGDSTAEVSEGAAESFVEIPSEGEKRLDWTLKVVREGSLKLRMSAQTQSASDAVEMSFPVLVHGVERALAQSGILRDDKTAAIPITLPEARKPGSSELVVQLNPSLAATMLDALPYLVEYPYGCIEQTMSRFIPCVVTAKTLKDAGYNLEDLAERARLLREQESKNGPAPKTKVENSPYSYPKGRPGSLRNQEFFQQKATWRWRSPVFNSDSLRNMVLEGLGRVRGFQHGDGGWGWWPGDSSDPYMTAYVLYGLITAKDAGYPVEPQMIDRGLEFLKGRYLEDDNFHRMAYESRVLTMDPRYREPVRALATGRLWENRERLSAYSRALFAVALHNLGEREKAETMLRNIETTAKVDAENGTASWTGTDGGWWRWWNNKVETNAAVLQAYAEIRPGAEMPRMMVKWLVNNRRGNTWNSTRETAMAVYALADYVRVNKELSPEYTLTVDLGGKVRREFTVTRENALFFDNQFVVPDELLETGAQNLTFTKDGPGTLYYSAFTRYFSLEEPIRATGNEIFVRRRYFRLLPGTASGQPENNPVDKDRPNPFLTGRYELLTDGGEYFGYEDVRGGPRYERVALKDGETVTSGDLLEVELQLESKNDYDYLVFEDLKPAGCEPVELRSGGRYGQGVWSNMELRDQKVAFFLTSLPQGTRTLSYRLRAEIPGRFHVLPTNGYAMYAPDIRCLSDEASLGVRDGE